MEHSGEAVQENDDGFFENFGSRLLQQSNYAAMLESIPLAPLLGEISTEESPEGDEDGGRVQLALELRAGADSDNGTLVNTDSENEDDDKIESCVDSVFWNMDELYKEILYQVIHNTSLDANIEIGQLALITYIQDAFRMTSDRHQLLMAEAEAMMLPEVILNVEIVEAKDTHPTCSNGLNNPFVTMYLISNQSQRYNTTVKMKTLSPTWEEHFSLPISKNDGDDILRLEVRNYDSSDTINKKLGKLFDVKGVKGLSKLVKETAVMAFTGKQGGKLIGQVSIPLKSVPTSGLTMWYSLDKKNKIQQQGNIKVKLSFSSKRNSHVATSEHRHLLWALLLHELDISKVAPYWWSESFSRQADAVIQQHAALSGLGQNENLLAKWTAFCTVHVDHHLSFGLFHKILAKLFKPLQSKLICEEEVKLFWDGVRKLLPSCFSIVRKIRKKTADDKAIIKMLSDILKILFMLSELESPQGIDLFPKEIYRWVEKKDDHPITDLRDVLRHAIIHGAAERFTHILEKTECDDTNEEGRLRYFIQVLQLVRSDLQRAVEYYNKVYVEVMNFPYAKTLYLLYQAKLTELIEPGVLDMCNSLRNLRYSEHTAMYISLAYKNKEWVPLGITQTTEEPHTIGTKLFELYLALQRFLTLGKNLCPADWSDIVISKFYSWFFVGVSQWLDIAVFKAFIRIEKAVELDQLVPVYELVKHSSSAVDTLFIFEQIKIFWQQLAWPDIEESYSFIARILDDICRCSVFYADDILARVDDLGKLVPTVDNSKFFVTDEWWLAINDIAYVGQKLHPFLDRLKLDDIVNKLTELRHTTEGERSATNYEVCKETLENVVENTIQTVNNKIIELLEKLVEKMIPSISQFLSEGTDLLHKDCDSTNCVIPYLEENLDILHENLNQENFTRTLDVIWNRLSLLFDQIIQDNLKKKRPVSFFSNLHKTLQVMMVSFKQNNMDFSSNETLQKVIHLLTLHSIETADLIQRYHLEKYEEWQISTVTPYGMLSVRALFTDSSIKIEVLNARDLINDYESFSLNSYVKIMLVPEDLFADTIQQKTKIQYNNLCPLYDEVFTINLTPEQRMCNGMIIFKVKSRFWCSIFPDYVGEAFLDFKDIPSTTADLQSLPQVHLKLARQNKLDGDIVEVLRYRDDVNWDMEATEFLYKQRQRLEIQ